MPDALPRSTPAEQGADPAAILRFLDAMEEHPGVEMHSLMVIRHGRVVAEGWWAPYSAGRPQLLYSLSKSFTSTAAAFAQAEGLLDLLPRRPHRPRAVAPPAAHPQQAPAPALPPLTHAVIVSRPAPLSEAGPNLGT
jgi:hypothetical protein